MSGELRDWIAPWIDDHDRDNGPDWEKPCLLPKVVQLLEFPTYRNIKDPNDHTIVTAFASDSEHMVRLVFDSEETDRQYDKFRKRRDYEDRITNHDGALYRILSYKLSNPEFNPRVPHRDLIATIHVLTWEHYCGHSGDKPYAPEASFLTFKTLPSPYAIDLFEERSKDRLNRRSFKRTKSLQESFARFAEEKEQHIVVRDAKSALAVWWALQNAPHTIPECHEQWKKERKQIANPSTPTRSGASPSQPLQTSSDSMAPQQRDPSSPAKSNQKRALQEQEEAVHVSSEAEDAPADKNDRPFQPQKTTTPEPRTEQPLTNRKKHKEPLVDYPDPVADYLRKNPANPDLNELVKLLINQKTSDSPVSVDYSIRHRDDHLGGEEGLKEYWQHMDTWTLAPEDTGLEAFENPSHNAKEDDYANVTTNNLQVSPHQVSPQHHHEPSRRAGSEDWPMSSPRHNTSARPDAAKVNGTESATAHPAQEMNGASTSEATSRATTAETEVSVPAVEAPIPRSARTARKSTSGTGSKRRGKRAAKSAVKVEPPSPQQLLVHAGAEKLRQKAQPAFGSRIAPAIQRNRPIRDSSPSGSDTDEEEVDELATDDGQGANVNRDATEIQVSIATIQTPVPDRVLAFATPPSPLASQSAIQPAVKEKPLMETAEQFYETKEGRQGQGEVEEDTEDESDDAEEEEADEVDIEQEEPVASSRSVHLIDYGAHAHLPPSSPPESPSRQQPMPGRISLSSPTEPSSSMSHYTQSAPSSPVQSLVRTTKRKHDGFGEEGRVAQESTAGEQDATDTRREAKRRRMESEQVDEDETMTTPRAVDRNRVASGLEVEKESPSQARLSQQQQQDAAEQEEVNVLLQSPHPSPIPSPQVPTVRDVSPPVTPRANGTPKTHHRVAKTRSPVQHLSNTTPRQDSTAITVDKEQRSHTQARGKNISSSTGVDEVEKDIEQSGPPSVASNAASKDPWPPSNPSLKPTPVELSTRAATPLTAHNHSRDNHGPASPPSVAPSKSKPLSAATGPSNPSRTMSSLSASPPQHRLAIRKSRHSLRPAPIPTEQQQRIDHGTPLTCQSDGRNDLDTDRWTSRKEITPVRLKARTCPPPGFPDTLTTRQHELLFKNARLVIRQGSVSPPSPLS